MFRHDRLWLRLGWPFAAMVLSLAIVGCSTEGEKRVTVTGRVTDGGQPIKLDPKGMLRIEFLRFSTADGKRQVQDAPSGDLDADGKYRVELPTGEYAVQIIHHPEYRGPNVLEKVFHGVDSPLTKKIDADLELDIEIDDFRQGK